MEQLGYREHAVLPPLREHVQYVWELRGPCELQTEQLIVPEPGMALMINAGAPMQLVGDEGRIAPQPRSMFVGEVRRSFTSRTTGGVDLIGVRFWPGAAGAFVDAEVREAVDVLSDESLLRPRLARAVVQTVLAAEPRDRVALLQRALLDELAQRGPMTPALIALAMRRLAATRGAQDIELLADGLRVSRRHLERAFVGAIGVAPKVVAGVLRFRHALDELARSGDDWARIAATCGYYDQSHLIRDFKRFAGRTPGRYVREGHKLAALRRG